MKYNRYETTWETANRTFTDCAQMGWDKARPYYRSIVAGAMSGHIIGGSTTMVQAMAEYEWVVSGKPYFNINPKLIPVFSKCPIDVPANLIKFPTNFSAFSINLSSPEEGNPMVIDKDHYVKSILCNFNNNEKISDVLKKLGVSSSAYREEDSNRIILWIDIGETGTEIPGTPPQPIYTYRQLAFKDVETVEEAMNKLPHHPSASEGVIVSAELTIQCIRLMASICFLVQSDDPLILPDVLAEDRLAIKWANADRKKQLHERARKKGKNGWMVGMDIPYTDAIAESHGHGTKLPLTHREGHELTRSHFRNGHWHVVRHGKNKELKKVIWYLPTTVRPDLPMK